MLGRKKMSCSYWVGISSLALAFADFALAQSVVAPMNYDRHDLDEVGDDVDVDDGNDSDDPQSPQGSESDRRSKNGGLHGLHGENEGNAEDFAGVGRDLGLSDGDYRRKFATGVGIVLGQAYPWMFTGVDIRYHSNANANGHAKNTSDELSAAASAPNERWNFRFDDFSYSFFFGSGSFTRRDYHIDTRTVDTSATTNGFGIASRWYPLDNTPFAFEGTLAFSQFKGKVTPQGTESGGSAGSTDPAQFLSAGYNLSAGTIGIATCFSKIWPNGIFFEWVPIGVRRSFILTKRLSTAQSADDDIVNEAVKGLVTTTELFGFINAKIGYSF